MSSCEKGVPNNSVLDIRITDILLRLGIHASCKGYEYLRCAIFLAYTTPDITCYVTKTLYPKVARLCHATSAANVERNCRHAIERACLGSRSDRLCRYFGYDVTQHRPTCAQFISTVAARLN